MHDLAAIASAVLVAALITCPGIAKQQAAGFQQPPAMLTVISEAPLAYDRDGLVFVLLCKRPITRSGPAVVLSNSP